MRGGKRYATKSRWNEIDIRRSRSRGKARRVAARTETFGCTAIVATLQQTREQAHAQQVAHVLHSVGDVRLNLWKTSMTQIVPRPGQRTIVGFNRQHVPDRVCSLRVCPAILGELTEAVGPALRIFRDLRHIGVGKQTRPQRIAVQGLCRHLHRSIQHLGDGQKRCAVFQSVFLKHARIPTNGQCE